MWFCPSVHQEHHFFRFNSHEYHLATGCSIRFVHKKPKENLKISRNCGSPFNLTFFFFFSKFRIAGYLEPRMNINFSADREFLLTKMTKHNIKKMTNWQKSTLIGGLTFSPKFGFRKTDFKQNSDFEKLIFG